jgi:hypothetical protein|nr:hypothetical protein [uncultured Acetatifactor sp.]
METLFIQKRFTMYGSGTLFTQTRFTMCGTETLFTSLWCEPEAFFDETSTAMRRTVMVERGLYYATADFAQMIKNCGGTWNDTKHRPIVCLIQSREHDGLYWAIPLGKLNHRDDAGQKRLDFYLNLPERDIRSCYYHIGRTSSQSIFFISDAIPITDKYIDGIHVGGDNQHYIIKNKNLISELERKLFRILSVENAKKNCFRQHITDVKCFLLKELKSDKQSPDKQQNN